MRDARSNGRGSTVQADATRLILNVAAQDQRRSGRSAFLRRAGYRVVEAASESQAIKAVVYRDVALAVLDGDLPQCDLAALGETLQRMRPAMGVVIVPTACRAEPAWPRHDISIHGVDRQFIEAVATAFRRDDSADPDVVTDVFGRIQGTSDHGARLLNGTPRGLFQRSLITFFDARRDIWHDAVRRARAGERVEMMGRLRPKERRPLGVSVRITSRTEAAGVMLEWVIDPSQPDV